MNCPTCSIKGKLKNTRRIGEETVRWYGCEAGHKWRTLEQLELVYDDSYVHAMRVETGQRLAAMREAREAEL